MTQQALSAGPPATAQPISLRRALAGAGAIAFAGIQLDSGAITIAYQPTSPVPSDQFSFPWAGETETATDVLRGLSAVFLLVALGYFARTVTRTCGTIGRLGGRLAVAGGVIFVVAYLLSILASGQTTGQPLAVAATVCFAASTLLIAIGMLLAGGAILRRHRWTSWRRYTPIAVGAWMVVLIPLQLTALLPVLVVVYSVLVGAFGVAILMEPEQ